jgi:hypothetical protein
VLFVLLLISVGIAFSQSPLNPAPSSLREQLIGSWSLASRVSTGPDGKVIPDNGLASTPAGILIYDRSGHVAAQLSRKNRTMDIFSQECVETAQIKGRPDTAQTVLGYDAYFGTYTIDEGTSTVTHHLDFALFPGDIGKDIKRSFTLDGNTLTIKFSTTTKEGVYVTRTLVWKRL